MKDNVLYHSWFEYTLHSVVIDLDDRRLKKEERRATLIFGQLRFRRTSVSTGMKYGSPREQGCIVEGSLHYFWVRIDLLRSTGLEKME